MTTDYGDAFSPKIAKRKLQERGGNVEKAIADIERYVAKMRVQFGVPFDDETQIQIFVAMKALRTSCATDFDSSKIRAVSD